MSCVTVKKEKAVCTITMSLPESMNSLEKHLREELLKALDEFSSDPECRVGVLTGSGKAFCSGGSLKELGEGMSAVNAVSYMKDASRIVRTITTIEKPIIASVNGAAIGAGFNIALACDMVIASSRAVFSQAFAKVGLVPDLGGMYFLPRIVGMHKAKELIYTAKMISADEALAMGMVNRVVPPDELEARTAEFALEIAAGPSKAFEHVKMILSRSLEHTLDDILEYEILAQAISIQSNDHKEGVQSFYQKRKPVFPGN